MRYVLMGIISMLAGFLFLVLGSTQAGLFLMFPFVVSTGPYAIIGSILIFIGFILMFLGFVPLESGAFHFDEPLIEKRGLGIVFIGPIPLIIDTKNKILTTISIAVFLIALTVLILYFVAAL
jgi:uncharacterized membrane protein